MPEIVVKGSIHHCQDCTIKLRKEHCKILRKIFRFIPLQKNISKNMNLWHFALKFVRFPITCKIVWSSWPELQAFNGIVLPNILLVSLNYHNAPFNFYKRMYTPHQHHHPATLYLYTHTQNLYICVLALCILNFLNTLCSVKSLFLWKFLLPGMFSHSNLSVCQIQCFFQDF